MKKFIVEVSKNGRCYYWWKVFLVSARDADEAKWKVLAVASNHGATVDECREITPEDPEVIEVYEDYMDK